MSVQSEKLHADSQQIHVVGLRDDALCDFQLYCQYDQLRLDRGCQLTQNLAASSKGGTKDPIGAR